MGKTLFGKERDVSHGNRYTKKGNIATQNEQKGTCSSSLAKKL